ncbi:hypothetical protein GCM10029964_055320 [Kibdelosporangium lantanae]
MGKILVVGGGYADFSPAWRLEKKLRMREAEVTIVDPRPYMTYQPFLPEVLAGSIEARQAAVSFRRHLRRTRHASGMITGTGHSVVGQLAQPRAILPSPFEVHRAMLTGTCGRPQYVSMSPSTVQPRRSKNRTFSGWM